MKSWFSLTWIPSHSVVCMKLSYFSLFELAKLCTVSSVAGPGHLQPPPAPCTGGGDQMTNTGSSDKGPAGTMASISVTATTTTTVQQTVTPESPATTGGQFGPPRLPPRPIQSHGRSISVDFKMKGDVGRSYFSKSSHNTNHSILFVNYWPILANTD